MRSLTPAKLNDLLNQLRHTTDVRGQSALSVWGDATNLTGLDVPDDGMVRLSPHVMGHYEALHFAAQTRAETGFSKPVKLLLAVDEAEETCEDTNASLEAYTDDGKMVLKVPLVNATLDISLAVEAMLMHVVLRNHGVKIREFS